MAEPLAEESGFELVDVEFGVHGRGRAIRVLLDKPGGITIGDCAAFSRRLADCLDMNQTVAGSYHLEVSSPGIDRPLRTLDAVRRFAGHRASLTLHESNEGRRRFDGDLLEPSGTRVGVRAEDGNEYWFEWASVRTARLVVDPWAEARAARARDREAPRGGSG